MGVMAQAKPHVGCTRTALPDLRVRAVRAPEVEFSEQVLFMRHGRLEAGWIAQREARVS